MSRINWKHTGPFCVAAFCQDFGAGMFFVAVPYVAMTYGAESLELGTLSAARSVAYIAACLTLPTLLAGCSRVALITVAVSGIGLAVLAHAATSSLWQLYALASCWALCLSLFWPSVFGWLGDTHSPRELGRATGAINISWNGGFMLGGLAGGFVYEIEWTLPFVFSALLPVIGAMVLLRRPAEHERPKPTPSGPPQVGARRQLAAAWMGNFSMCVLFGLMYGVFPRLGKDLGVTTPVFGAFLFILGMGRFAMFLHGYFGSRLVQNWRAALAIQWVAGVMVATVVTASAHWWLALVFLATGMGLGVSYYRGLYASLAGEGARGKKSGVHEATILMGALLGSFAGGVLADTVHLRAPYPAAVAMVSLLGLAQIALMASAKRAAGKGDTSGSRETG